MSWKKFVLLFELIIPVMACFSIGDLSAVEVELPVNTHFLLSAKNVVVGDTIYFKYKNTIVQVTNNSLRISFPVEEKIHYSCYAEGPFPCLNESPTTIKTDNGTFNAYLWDKKWVVSLDYIGNAPKVPECVNLSEMECTNNMIPVPTISEQKVKERVEEVLRLLNKEGIIELSEKDIQEIVNASKLGNAGHNGRIVKEGTWKPYYSTANPKLIRMHLTGGCGRGQVIEEPKEEIKFPWWWTLIQILKRALAF